MNSICEYSQMAENKNQHFVPQFYLRNFSGSAQRKSISVYNISNNVHIPSASIKGQCAKPFLYGKDLSIEKMLQKIEGNASKAVSAILCSGAPLLPGVQAWADMIKFIVFQRGRTPAAGIETKALTTQVAKHIIQASESMRGGDRVDLSSLEVQYKDPVVTSLIMHAPLGGVIADLRDVLIINKSDIEFIASDIAVVFYNQWTEGAQGIGTTGLASGGLQVFLPLSPRHLLLRYDQSVYKVGIPGASTVEVEQAKEVMLLNGLQHMYAEENLYYSGDSRTASAIDKLRGRRRAPRHTLIHSGRFAAADKSSEVIHFYQQQPKYSLDLSWLAIRRNARRKSLEERTQTYRQEAMDAYNHLRGENSRTRKQQEDAVTRTSRFYRVPDDHD